MKMTPCNKYSVKQAALRCASGRCIVDKLIYAVIGFLAGFGAAAFLILKSLHHAETLTNEIESEPDHNTPHFTRRSGEGLEGIKKYGIWF